MALRLRSSANTDTTPLHLPIAAPLPSRTNNTDAGINASKRPRLVDNIAAEYLQYHAQQQQQSFYEHGGSTVEAQLQHHQDQLLQQPDWAALQLQLDAPPQQQEEQDQFQQLQQLRHSQHSEDILADGAGFLPFYSYLPELAPEQVQFISPHLNHQPLRHPEQQLTPHLNHQQHLHHPEQQLSPPSPALAFDPSLTFLHGPLPMSSVVALPPGAFQQQQQQHPPAVLMPPPPPPPPTTTTTKPHANTPRPRALMTSTSATAAAALSSSSASAALAYASSSSATGGPSACTLRIGGYTLEEAGIKLPHGLSDAERRRRLRIIAEELHHEATHPPVLPPSQVPDLPEKPPPVPLPRITADMTQAQREATNAEILRLSHAQKKADQSRNNLAAKKSRMLRLECLDNTRLQLDAKSAECIWLRVQIVALSGEPLPRRPSEAWGGFDYVYRARKRRRRRLLTLLEDEDGAPGGATPAPPPPRIKVEEKEEGDEGEDEEDEDEEEPDVEGIVPRRVKEAITEEVRARVEAHREAVEEDSRRKTSASRSAKKSEAAAKAEAAKAEAAAAKTDKRGRQRRGSGGGKRKQ
ncbi:hypothetical protein BBO_06354 [Beauveria brongniartii RCEF 3172]|uniref:Uncharacterized protein n=1 Tax=Beauveria brongniartii RCEF 3172 TaxID=1081107 RepID=A0A162J5R9_9HYPO|nr:hypothetical protein BBO_06354 [Beauveria brongniartii RCEF 3172]